MAAKISICIPSYRGARRLERLFTTFPDDPDLELLLFDPRIADNLVPLARKNLNLGLGQP